VSVKPVAIQMAVNLPVVRKKPES